MKVLLIVLSTLFIVGCSKPVVVTEYQEVIKPVRVYIHRDDRPIYSKQSMTQYILEILEHCKKMELSIDTNNHNISEGSINE